MLFEFHGNSEIGAGRRLEKMKKCFIIAGMICMAMLAGCAEEPIPETVASTVAEQQPDDTQIGNHDTMVTHTIPATPETVIIHEQIYNYGLLTDESADTGMIPRIALSSDGTYGFTYDVISSYVDGGTYKVDGDLLKAVTADGDKEFNFRIDQTGNLVFLKQESADISLTDDGTGVPVVDGSVFSLNAADDDFSTMTATVKEIMELSVLVTSHEDSQPGAFYVEVPPTVDLSAFEGGETVTIVWYGLIWETYPAQITAMYMYQ